MTAPLCCNPRCRQPRKQRPNGKWYGARGLCGNCYARARSLGFPDVVPDPIPPRMRNAPARARYAAEREARILEFADLRARRFPVVFAARVVGVQRKTAWEYAAELRRRQRDQQTEAA
jgi:hypothetical protein